MSTILHRPIVVIKFSKRVADIIRLVRSIIVAMTGNANFPTPSPTLATLTSQVDELEVAETATKARTNGAVQVRNVKLDAVKASLEQERAYVQTIANGHTVADAHAIIASAGMSARAINPHAKQNLVARRGPTSGSVDLVAKAAAKRASYEWQFSLDQHTWTSATATVSAKTTVPGLTVGSTYYFRLRSITKTGPSDWGVVVSLVVT